MGRVTVTVVVAVRVREDVAVAVDVGPVVDVATGSGVAELVGGTAGVAEGAVDAVVAAVAPASVLVANAGVGLANRDSVATALGVAAALGVAVATAWPETDGGAATMPTSRLMTINDGITRPLIRRIVALASADDCSSGLIILQRRWSASP